VPSKLHLLTSKHPVAKSKNAIHSTDGACHAILIEKKPSENPIFIIVHQGLEVKGLLRACVIEVGFGV
jgi:hypothetical protein